MNLRLRTTLCALLVCAAILGAGGWLAVRSSKAALTKRAQHNLNSTARLLTKSLSDNIQARIEVAKLTAERPSAPEPLISRRIDSASVVPGTRSQVSPVEIDPRWIQSIVEFEGVGPHREVFVVDGAGTVIASRSQETVRRAESRADWPPVAAAIARTKASPRYEHPRLGPVLHAAGTVPAAGWHLLIMESEDAALVAVTALFERALLLSLVALILGTALGAGLFRTTSEPPETSAPAPTVDELRRKNLELEALVVRDPVTNLFNHQFLQETLERELRRSQRHNHLVSLVLVDVDGFAGFNEGRTHEDGDKLLAELAAEIQVLGRIGDLDFRPHDGQIIARFDADVFALVLPETTKSGAATKAERVRKMVEADSRFPITISAGIATFPHDAVNRAALVKAANSALTAAKRGGRNRIVPYSPALADSSTKRTQEAEIERLIALDRVIEKRAFQHVYQPIVRADSGDVFAYEWLCRLDEPAFRGPSELFSEAVLAGRIKALGKAARVGAMEPIERLPKGCFMFINLNPLEIRPTLFESEPELTKWAHRIVLEVTESAEITDYQAFIKQLDRLRELGFRIAVDDLGAGYAGLTSLAKLRPDFVKLDMGLVRNIRAGGNSARLIRHIIEYATDEGIQTIAEGVETESERDALAELNCPLFQGYLFGRPAPY